MSCETQEEINHYWERLSARGEIQQGGWLNDKFGVSQIFPSALPEMMRDIDKAKAARAIRAILGMKKFDIAELRAAYEGSVPTPLCNLPKMMTMPVERNRAGRRGLLPILWLSNG